MKRSQPPHFLRPAPTHPALHPPAQQSHDTRQQHPQSQAPLDSNGNQPSINRSSVTSAEGDRVPMLPGGAQSSLMSTAIVAADDPGAGGDEYGDDGASGGDGGGGSSGGKTIEASAEGSPAADGDSDG